MCIWGKAPEQRYIRTWLSRVYIVRHYLGPDAKKEREKKTVFGVSEKVSFKPAFLATETS